MLPIKASGTRLYFNYPELFQGMIFIRVNLVFHEAEVHRMIDDVGISWRNSVIYRKGKKSLSILSVKIIT